MPSKYQPVPVSEQKKRGPKSKPLTADQINLIHEKALHGENRKKIAEELEISYYLIKKYTNL